MKKQSLLFAMLILLGAITLQSQDSIPNNSFENWITNTSPNDWHTVNELLPFGFFACNQTTNSYSGSYALSMKTIDLDGFLVPAVASLGTVGMGFTEGGVPYTDRPESLKGYFKHPSSDDVVMLVVQFYKQGIEIGTGYWATSDSVAAYTLFEAPIEFSSAENPDTMNITMITDQNITGSSMTIDALQFEFPPVKVEEVQHNSIRVYPNPCYDVISIETEEEIISIEVISLSGEIVIQGQNSGSQKTIDLRKLPEGLYILKMLTESGSFSQKIMKQPKHIW